MANLNQTGENNPFWKGGKHTYNCFECGNEFEAHKSEHDRGGAKFCSKECGYKNKRRRVKFDCEICGKEVEQRKYDYDRNKHHFCSYKCSGIWTSENLIGGNNHNYGKKFAYEHRKKIGDSCRGEKNWRWKGGVKSENEQIRNRMDYKDWRTAVFERDNYTCQRCLDRNGFGKAIYLEAHHIIPFAVAIEERFEADNGATLCKPCHDYIHVHELSV